MVHYRIHPIISGMIGLCGLSAMVIIHELGHFLMCKWFGVTTPVFSIGFGPSLIGYTIGKTYFQIALLPLGGYVSIAENELKALPYIPMALIILAGIVVNFLFALIIFTLLRGPRLAYYSQLLRSFLNKNHLNGLIGPIGIITVIGTSIQYGLGFFLFILALLSLNIAFFNLLPIPFFDGGQLVWRTIEHFFGPLSPAISQVLYMLFLILIVVVTAFIASKDFLRLRR